MINADERSAGMPVGSSSVAVTNLPRCVCSWKNCRTYQKGFREAKHEVFDGVIKLKFVKGHPASQALKDSIDRVLRVPPERSNDWKPGRKDGEQITRYVVARHHYTEKHIQKYLADPKGFSFVKPFSIHGARKYLHSVDPNEVFQLPSDNDAKHEVLYLQCPNVPREVVRNEFMRIRESVMGHQEALAEAASPAKNKYHSPPTTSAVPTQGVGEKKDSLTVSTTRSQVELEKEVKSKEEENIKLKHELDMMKSQLTFLHDMVRKLQEEHFSGDHVSVRSGRSHRSQSVSNRHFRSSSRSARTGVPREINLGEDEDGNWDQEQTEDWTDDPTNIADEDDDDGATFKVTYRAARRGSIGNQSVGGASIMSASKSVKTLPRELELDEEDGSDSNDSLEEDAFDARSFASAAYNRSTHSRSAHSRSTHSRSTHSRSPHGRDANSVVGGRDFLKEEAADRPSNAMSVPHRPSTGIANKKPSRRSSIGDASHRSARTNATSQSAGTYEVSAMAVTDPYGEKGSYTGSISQSTGMPHGFGRLEYDRAGRWYEEGDWKHGRWTGHGRLSNGDGDFYEGGLKNDHKHGQGIMKFADGRAFEGEYINGQMIQGKMTYQDGSTYAGGWVDGMRHGRGRCMFMDESIYEGEFREGEFSGYGKMQWSDGGWYQGEWWNGEMHGKGKEMRPDRSIRHDGEWCKGQPIRK